MRNIFEYSANSLYIRSMKPWGRFIFIFIAYGIALLHTAVPHEHAEDSGTRHVISHPGCVLTQSFGGLLQMVLSTDLGVGHLETFQKSADTSIGFSIVGTCLIAVIIPLLFLPPILREFSGLCGDFIETLFKRLILFSSCHLRAPPVC